MELGSDVEFWEEIDQLLMPLTERFERDMLLFDVVLTELGLMIEMQQNTYRDNLEQVVNASSIHSRAPG